MLFLLGLLVGILGTLIGAGGGFLLVPVLLLLYPHERPDSITAVSLAVVFLNALSGSIAYARMRRIDHRSGLLFAAATIPGAVLGAYATRALPRSLFDPLFGVVLVVLGGFLLWNGARAVPARAAAVPGHLHRVVVDATGTRHEYAYHPGLALAISVVVGFASSMLGIGGGILHVPALMWLLGFPAHVATATSHFVLAFMALAGTLVHVANGTLDGEWSRVLWIGAGALVGAQVGARLSTRVHGRWIVRSLALGLVLVGLRVLLPHG